MYEEASNDDYPPSIGDSFSSNEFPCLNVAAFFLDYDIGFQ